MISKFFISKHFAKKAGIHYDIRIKMLYSDIWASFACRKEVPIKEGERVLVVKTRNHTEEDALFVGNIEDGYGAGKLEEWDKGSCHIIQFRRDHIAVEFNGKKIKGLYHFILFKKDRYRNSYLFFKGKIKENEIKKQLENSVRLKNMNSKELIEKYLDKITESFKPDLTHIEELPEDIRDSQIARIGIAAELDAINLYETLADMTDNDIVKDTLLQIAEEEKVHVGEFMTLMREFDSEYDDSEEKGEGEVEDKMGEEEEIGGVPSQESDGQGRRGGFSEGPGGECVCPKCGETKIHKVDTPCHKEKCPKCGEDMTRRRAKKEKK